MVENPFVPKLYREELLAADYRDWTRSHVWVHKQPVPLWTIASSLSLFGNTAFAVRIPSILLSTVSIYVLALFTSKLFNQRTALFAAFLLSVNGLLIELTAGRAATDHIDVHFMAFILFAIYFAYLHSTNRRRWNLVASSFFIGLAILSKWLPALIVLPIWGILYVQQNGYDHRKMIASLLAMIGIITAIVLPWQIYIMKAFPLESAWEYAFNRKHIFEALEGHIHPWYFHLDRMRISYGELVYLPIGWVGLQLYRSKDLSYLMLLVWIVVPYAFFTLVATKMKAYTLFVAPALFIATALLFVYLYENRNQFRFRWLVNTILILLIALPVRYSVERIKPFKERAPIPAIVPKIQSLKLTADSIVVIKTAQPIEIMFYTGAMAYDKVPTLEELESIVESGYTVFTENHDELPIELKQSELVHPF